MNSNRLSDRILEPNSSKAVADGTVIWNTITSVFVRAARWSFGIQGYVRHDPHSSDHRDRARFTTPDGYEKVSGIWCEIVRKVRCYECNEPLD